MRCRASTGRPERCMAEPATNAFATQFDLPAPALEPPSDLASGVDPALRIVDGFVRGVGIVGRFGASPAMLAMKVASAGRPVRVTALVRLDGTAVRWWDRRVPASTPGRD